ncbi:hypothetical protein VHUM_03243 [Vanrija humicola]|uniref:Cyclase n=1 Tax=Vanrija humicola TaxID=5417 RepID=A0A7D8Z1V2_VANHU|nr:hypothetical protein VHUM_03243 [Vanrija humicola]
MTTPPPFDDLPLARPGPPFNAWGLYGADDELGRLNLITPEVVAAAGREVKDGIVVNLNAQGTRAGRVSSLRWAALSRSIAKGYANDDHLSFNTQCSTQWDGFKHYPYQNYPEQGQHVHYNGMTYDEARKPENKRLGIDNFTRKPITSRAHLLDIPRHVAAHGGTLSHLDNSTPISVAMLDACAVAQGVEFRPGDILLVYTGWNEAYARLSDEDKKGLAFRKVNACIGVQTGEEAMRWHWDKGFAAVASDAMAYEAWPPLSRPSLHEVFLGGWGLPIGETFDLRALAAECARLGRWTFLFTSVALYVPGGIASPANAQAVL